MAKHAKNRARPAAIRAYLTAGVTGAAFAGLGAFLAVQDATPATTQYDIKLVSNEEDTLFLSLNGGSDRRDREQRALAAQEVTDANPALRPMFGDGGWLIGNGLDAVEGCEGAACGVGRNESQQPCEQGQRHHPGQQPQGALLEPPPCPECEAAGDFEQRRERIDEEQLHARLNRSARAARVTSRIGVVSVMPTRK